MQRTRRYALLLALAYMAAGAVYIVFTDLMARAWATTVDELAYLELAKGITFVLVTAAGLYRLTRLLLERLAREERAAARARDDLLASERRATAGLFASSVAHDANNLLAVINAEIAVLRAAVGMEQQTDLDHMKAAADRMALLFRNLMKMGRSHARELRRVDVVEEIQAALAVLRTHPVVKENRLVVDAPVSLEAAVHVALVQQILVNLVLNAAEAHPGGVIQVRLARVQGRLALEVHDDGPGVRPEQVDSLFEPYFTTKTGGTGLGLPSVKAAAEAHGGGVEVERSPLGGALFRVWLEGPAEPLRAAG